MRDHVRGIQVAETPEERVRQAVLVHLTDSMHVPKALIAVEKGLRVQNELKRADVIVHDRTGAPWMVIECKAPDVKVDQATLDQAANYNRVLKAPFVWVTNGTTNLCARINAHETSFLEALPIWPTNE